MRITQRLLIRIASGILALILALSALWYFSPTAAGLAYDNDTSGTITSTGSVSHTPVGTPRAVAVVIVQEITDADLVSGVTYGGQTLSREATATDTNLELARTYIYFLGSSIPTGTQDATVTVSSGTDAKRVTVYSFTASVDTQIAGTGTLSENADPPSATLNTASGFSGEVVGGLFSGLGVTGNITSGSGYTMDDQYDFGASTGHAQHGTKSGANVVFDFVTSGIDDVALAAIAIEEVASGSAPAAPTLLLPIDTASGVGTLPRFELRSTDADSDYLRYKIEVCSTSNCSSIVRTIDQTASQTGWSAQDQQGATAYTGATTIGNSAIAIHFYQDPALSPNTQYWWRAFAIDPAGSNSFSSASGVFSFITVVNETRINGGSIIQGGTNIGN